MVMTMRVVTFLAVAFSLLAANTYCISPNGNDNNPGTLGSPLLTIQAGINKAYPSDLVMVLAGTYKEQVTFPRSGVEGSPITVRGQIDEAGHPLTIIDNTTPVNGDSWVAAPEVGVGVYKRTGFNPSIMLWNGCQIRKIDQSWMSGYSDWSTATGFTILNYDADRIWLTSTSTPIPWWDDVEMVYGVLNGDTTYIRKRNRAPVDTCVLRAGTGASIAINIDSVDYITIERLQIQGSVTGIELDHHADHNVIQDCVIKHGGVRIYCWRGSSYNTIRRNDLSLGYGSYGKFGEWGGYSTPRSVLSQRHYAAYHLGKYMEGASESEDEGLKLDGSGGFVIGNAVDSNYMHDGSVAIELYQCRNTVISNNHVSNYSSIFVYHNVRTESLYIYNNDVKHINLFIRHANVGDSGDTTRTGWVYKNRVYNDSSSGECWRIHGGVGLNESLYYKLPHFWFYHNSYAGGYNAITPRIYATENMKSVNDIYSCWYLGGDTDAESDSVPGLFAGFDYNFLGGRYKGSRRFQWALRDSHNIVYSDTLNGSGLHQVWKPGSEPDWIVPDTSPAYQSGLDLSDSFMLRGVKYGPLPGMTPGYFTGAKPNLGAVQDAGHMGTPQRDPRRGSVTQRLELAFAPNPATCGSVMARCVIPTGNAGKLTLRDVVGRTVKSIPLVPSGNTQLDLRGFAPGVYVAKLETTGPPVSRKLIITAH